MPFEDQDKEISKCLEVIQGLRSMAYELTSYNDMREYYWGLLFDTIFSVFSSDQGTEKWGRGLVFASILCERLSHWNDEWPTAGVLTGNIEL
jgi:hypothetical protein